MRTYIHAFIAIGAFPWGPIASLGRILVLAWWDTWFDCIWLELKGLQSVSDRLIRIRCTCCRLLPFEWGKGATFRFTAQACEGRARSFVTNNVLVEFIIEIVGKLWPRRRWCLSGIVSRQPSGHLLTTKRRLPYMPRLATCTTLIHCLALFVCRVWHLWGRPNRTWYDLRARTKSRNVTSLQLLLVICVWQSLQSQAVSLWNHPFYLQSRREH